MNFNALCSRGGVMQTLSADCGSRLRDLVREFRVAASSVGWEAERLKTYAEMLDEIALALLIEEDSLYVSQ